MMYFQGREIRSDEETKGEAFKYMVSAALIYRVPLMVLYAGKNCYIPFIHVKMSSMVSLTLYILLVFLNAFFFVFALDHERRMFNSLKAASIPPFISLLVHYSSAHRMIVGILASLFFLTLVVPGVTFFWKWFGGVIQHKRLKKKKVFRRLFRGAYESQTIIATVSVSIFAILALLFPFVRRFDVLQPTLDAEVYQLDDKESSIIDVMEAHTEDLQMLNDEIYPTLSKQERLDALQILLNCECTYMGLDDCPLQIRDMQDCQAGYYSNSEDVIAISEDNVMEESPHWIISVVCHEAYHKYQYHCLDYIEANGLDINDPVFMREKQWKKEFENYNTVTDESSEEDINRYLVQDCEISADDYGWEQMNIIINYLN